MLLVQYPRPMEITHDQEGEFLCHEFKSGLIEKEYGIKTNPYYSGNPQVNANIERIHQVLGNLVRTYNLHGKYVDDAEPWMGILAAASFMFLKSLP